MGVIRKKTAKTAWGHPILSIIFLAVFVFSLFMFASRYLQKKQEQAAFNSLSAIVAKAEAETASKPSANAVSEPSGGAAAESAGAAMSSKYSGVAALNSDFAGWLSVPGAGIDLPVMLTPYDSEYYLHRAFDKSSSKSGTPFIGSGGDTESDCFIIYAHNMKNGTMFGSLDNYNNADFWESNRYFSFDTVTQQRSYEVFAAIETQLLSVDEPGLRYYNYSGALTEAEFEDLTYWLISNSLYSTNVVPNFGEQILLLSTCSYHTNEGRFVVAARRLG